MKTATVRRVVFDAPYSVRLETSPISEDPGQRSMLVRSEVSLISPGTELALFTGTHVGFKDPEITWARYPLYPGYATVGVVEKVGSVAAGDENRLRAGDRVLHYKPHADAVELNADTDFWFPLPAGIRPEEALFARFGQIARTAVEASRLSGNTLVFGAGIVGNLAAQLFRELKGVRTIVSDMSAKRLDVASRCGLADTLLNSEGDIDSRLKDATKGEGVSTVVEATGVPALVAESLRLVNRLGEVILLGSSRGKVELDAYKLIHRKATALVGAHESRYPSKAEPGAPSQDMFCRDALSRIASGSLIVRPFITDRVAPEKIGDAYDLLIKKSDDHIGIIVEWQK